jgi:uncharacterized membrane protein YphA (DoxX/SURF4 family)
MNDAPLTAAPPSPAAGPQPPAAWRRVAGFVGGLVLGGVLLFAGWAKALDPEAFTRQVRDEGLEILLPAAAIALVALAIEFFLGTALMLGVRSRLVLWPTTALVAFFIFLTGRTYWNSLRGIEPPSSSCGCFGRMLERTPGEAFWQDLLLLLPPLLLAWLAITPGKARGRLAVAAVVTCGLTLFAFKAPDLPLDDYVTALKPEVKTGELCAGNAALGARTCLDGIVPELALGAHLLIVADISADAFKSKVSELNEFHWLEGAPKLWVLSSATEEELFQLKFGHGPSFEIREAPAPLLSTFYRRLPRSFLVQDGEVVETFDGIPPLDRWRTKPPSE